MHDKNQPYYYFRMVEPDFTPLPVYDSDEAVHRQRRRRRSIAGVHQADDWAIQHDADAQIVTAPGAQFDTALQAKQRHASPFAGRTCSIRWIGALSDTLTITVDGQDAGTSQALVAADCAARHRTPTTGQKCRFFSR